MILKFLLEKEFKQFFRNPFLPKLMVAFPIMIMLVIPWIANMDVKNIEITVVNHDSSSAAEDLIRTIESSTYFILTDVTADYDKAMEELEYGETDAIMEIPDGFEEDLLTLGKVPVQISINAINQTLGSLGSSYLMAICSEFSRSYLQNSSSAPSSAMPKVNISVQNRYNLYMDYKLFMIPALMVIVLLLMGGFLPALNIVGEKEKGTIEQINITPVPRLTFIAAKLIPYWIIGFVVLTVTMLVGRIIYGIWPAGSIWTIYIFSLLFICTVSGFGLVVSNYASTMQQATFICFFFMLIFMLMSGLLTPISSMPQWAQSLTIINPPRYFIEAMRPIYLKGGRLRALWPQFFAMIAFSAFFSTWAILSYRKRN